MPQPVRLILRDVLRDAADDDLLGLCLLKSCQRLRNLIACSLLGVTMLSSGDGMFSSADENADRNSDANDLTGSVRR